MGVETSPMLWISRNRPQHLLKLAPCIHTLPDAWPYLVCGLLVSAVTIGTGGSANGPEPWVGLQGAEAVSHLNGGQGPGEQTASLASHMAIALHFEFEMRLRVVGRISYGLRRDPARDFRLHSARKR